MWCHILCYIHQISFLTGSLLYMAYARNEFYCSSCGKYFDFKLNMALNQNYRIHCPNCGHVHYRKVENGLITDTRFFDNQDSLLVEDIRPMKSSCRDFSNEKDEDCYFSDTNPAEGFMSRLWKENFSGKA